MLRTSTSTRLVLLIAALGTALGCGSGGPEIVAIEGTVTHKGKPVPGLRVYFQPTDGRPSWGDTDNQGHFRLDYDVDHDGAKVGTHKVYVVDASSLDPTMAPLPGGKPPEYKDILAKYGNPVISPKTVEVTKADKNLKLELD